MAVQHQLGTLSPQHRSQGGTISEHLAGRDHAIGRWMVQHHDAEQALPLELMQFFAQPDQLRLTQGTAGKAGRGGHGAGKADQRHTLAHPHIGQGCVRRAGLVALHPRQPMRPALRERHRHQGIVVAGDHRDIGRLAQRGKPRRSGAELRRQREIADIARDGEMVRCMGLDVGHRGRQHLGALQVLALAHPGGAAHAALAQPLAERRWRQRRGQVRV